jgi:hypothetical protein
MTREYTPAELGIKPAQKEYSAEELGLLDTKPTEAREYTASELGLVPPAKSSLLRETADIPLKVSEGAVAGVRMIADAFGANNPVSKNLRSVENYIADLYSAQSKADSKRVAEIMKEAEDKGLGPNLRAAFEAFKVAPVDLLSSALGTAAPTILGGLGAGALKLGTLGVSATQVGLGATTGAGVTKGAIYDSVKEELSKTEMPEKQVEARAQLAQAYGGENLDQILAGAALGGVAGTVGIESALVPGAVKKIISGAGSKSVLKEAGLGAAKESIPEVLQGSQEQLAQNLALQREGFDVPTMRGVVGQGALEGLAGAGLGATVGAVSQARDNKAARALAAAEQDIALPGTAGLTDEQMQETRDAYIKRIKEQIRGKAAALRDQELPEAAEAAVAQPAPIVAEEATTPVTKLDRATINSLGLRTNTNAYKALDGLDITTPEGRTLFEQTIIANQDKVKEDKVNELLAALPPIEPEVQNEPVKSTPIEPAADRAGVSTPDEQRLEIPAEGAVETDRGAVDVSGANVGQPAGGTEQGGAPLESLKVGDTTVVGAQTYRKTDTGFELVAPEETPNKYLALHQESRALEEQAQNLSRQSADPEFEATNEQLLAMQEQIKQLRQQALDKRKEASRLPDNPSEVDATAILGRSQEEAVAEDPTKQARSLSNELRSLDPTDPLIEDLLAYDVDEDTIAQARNTIAQIVQERQAKGQTQPGELRELSEDLAATEGEPETEAMYRSLRTVNEEYGFSIEELDARMAEVLPKLLTAQESLEKTRNQMLDTHNELSYLRYKNIDSDAKVYFEEEYRLLAVREAEIKAQIEEYEDAIKSIELDQTITVEEFKRDRKRAELFEDEDYEGLIDALIADNSITREQAAFFEALFKGDVKAALEAIAKLPLTAKQTQILQEGEPGKAYQLGGRQLFKYYKDLARELIKAKVIPNGVIFSKNLKEGIAGDYSAETDTVRIDAGEFLQTLGGSSYMEAVNVFLHEVMHSATVNAMSKGMANITIFNEMGQRAYELEQEGDLKTARSIRESKGYKDAEKYLKTAEGIAAKNLFDIYDYLSVYHPEVFTSKKYYGATNPLEMIAEAQVDPRFQQLLMGLKLPAELATAPGVKGRGFKNIWSLFTDAVRRILHLPQGSNDALSAVMANTAAVVRQNRTVRTSTTEEQYGRSKIYEKYRSYGNTIASKAKKQAVETLQKKSGIKKPSNKTGKSLFKSVMDADLNHAIDNLSSAVLSSDNGLNNQMRTALEKAGMPWSQIKEILEGLMTSQATHSQNVATMFLEMGKIGYNKVANMFEVTENPNGSWGSMLQTISDLAKKYGMSMDEMELAAHTYFVANRSRGLINSNNRLKKKALALELAGKRKEADRLLDKIVLVNMTPAEIKAGLDIRKEIPELGQVVEQWNVVRLEVINHLVNTGLYSQEQAAELADTFDYVPFYREAQLEANQGPKENTRGLLDRARQKHIKGSYNPVNNVFDNMNRWITYSIARGINNSQGQYAVKAMQQNMVGSISPKPLPPTAKVPAGNLVAVWENGVEKRYRVEDPMFVHYFTGARAAYAPWVNTPLVTGVNKVFRAEIILDPIFSAGQVMMDGLTAMFTSGTKHFYMLPIRAVKEFVLTIPNWSKTHKALRGYGAVGETDFASVSKRLAEEAKYEARDMNTAEKIAETLLKPLRWITTASDNAIRQAVYEQEMAESGDKATAIRKAFEVINFRRAGYSSRVNTLRQSVNFTGAYLQYVNVSSKVLTGKGITPTQKKQSYVRLVNALAGYGLFSFLLFMDVSDDDEYQETDQTTRDLRQFIPRLTEKLGVWLPVRADPFMLIAKMLPEHIYNLARKEGGEDWTKFKKAFKAYMASAALGPTPIPQLPKVALETMMNKSITTGRPIVGGGIEGRATEREMTSTTSEFSKMLGSTGLVSPVMADYWINNLGASVGRAFIFLTNALMKDSEAPEPSTRDKLASFAPKFIKREFGTRAKNDLYELRDIVDEAYATYKDVQRYGSKEEYDRVYEETIDKVKKKPVVDVAIKQLAQIRADERKLLEKPPGDMTKEQKEAAIKRLREKEQIILFDIQYKRDLSGLDKGNPFR